MATHQHHHHRYDDDDYEDEEGGGYAESSSSSSNSSCSGDEEEDDEEEGAHDHDDDDGTERHRRKDLPCWDDMYDQLWEFRLARGHCNVGYAEDPPLARWVHWNQCLGREHRLALSRQEKLERIGFAWGLVRDQSLWDKQFERLCAYQKKHGDCKVPRIYPPDRSLGTWVKNQRYRHRNDMVKPEERQKLDSIGFDWGLNSYESYWQQNYEKLKLYARIHGHCRVPKTYPADQPLSDWISLQRQRHRTHKMTADRAAKLAALHFDWTPKRGRPAKNDNDEYGDGGGGGGKPAKQRKMSVADSVASAAQNDDLPEGYAGHYQESYRDGDDDDADNNNDYPEDYEHHHEYAHPSLGNDDDDNNDGDSYEQQQLPHPTSLESRPSFDENDDRRHGAASPEVSALWQAVAADDTAAWATERAYSPATWHAVTTTMPPTTDHYAPTDEYSHGPPPLQVGEHHQQQQQQHQSESADGGFGKPPPQPRVPWEVMYQSLAAYQRQHGDCLVPRAYDKILSTWVDTQRATFRAHTIYDDRRDRLNELGFVWDTSTLREQRWNAMYERLVAYRYEHGTTAVPRTYEEDPALATWVDRNRQYCARGDRVAKLNDIGFVWAAKHHTLTAPLATDGKWQEMFDTIKEYKRFYGDCLVPRDFQHFPALGSWVEKQRVAYRGSVLPMDRITLLNGIGFAWDISAVKKEEAWDVMLEKLIEYKAQHGNCNVPRHYKQDLSLGGWVGRNRHHGRQGNITAERKEKLDALGFHWGEFLDKGIWDAQFEKLKNFRAEFGHCRVPLGFKSDRSLANWVKYQRQRDKLGLMDAGQRDKLNSLNFAWCQTLQQQKAKKNSTGEAVATGTKKRISRSKNSSGTATEGEEITPAGEASAEAGDIEFKAVSESATNAAATEKKAADESMTEVAEAYNSGTAGDSATNMAEAENIILGECAMVADV